MRAIQDAHLLTPPRHVVLAWPVVQLVQKRLSLLQSLDTSREVPVYVIKVAKALQRVVQQNDAEFQQVRCCTALLLYFAAQPDSTCSSACRLLRNQPAFTAREVPSSALGRIFSA